MAFQDFYDEVQKLYIAYYQRPADPGGLRFWAQRLEASGGSLEGIIDAFATSPEAVSLYDFDSDGAIDLDDADDMIDAIYQALFNRAPDAAGKQFYLDALTNGQFPDGRPATPGRVALDILNGARNEDAVAIANKLEMATLFTHILDPNDDGVGPFTATYSGPGDEAAGRAFLAQFTADPTTLKTQGQVADDIRTTIADAGDPILNPTTLALTPGVDNINITDPGSFDQVTGIVDGDGDGDTSNSTFTPGDVIDGNGLTELRLTVVESGDAAFATVKDVSEVNLIAGDDVFVDFNAADWQPNVDSIHYAGGVDGMSAFFDNLSANRVDLVFDFTTTGSLSASYTDDLWVGMFLFGVEGGKASFIDENFAVTVVDGGAASIEVSSSNDVSLGDLAATVGDFAFFSYSVDVSGTSTDLSLGDIAIDAGDLANVVVFIQNTDTAGDLSVGDISLNLGVTTSFTVTISATNDETGHALGDFSVGDIDLVLADEAFGSMFLLHTQNTAAAGAGIGRFTVGDMSVQMGADTTLTVSLSQLLFGTGTGTMGDVTIGKLDVAMGIGAQFFYELSVSNSITSDIGSVTIGDVNLAMDDGALVSYTVEISQSGTGDIQQVVIGDVSVVMGVSASIDSWSYSITAFNGNIGSVTVGDLNAVIGQNADFDDYTLDIFATNGTIDSVTVGDLTATIASGGSFSYSVTIEGDLGVGEVSFGDVNVSANGASSVSLEYFISAFSGDVGTVTFGDIDLAAAGNLHFDFFATVSASGDAGQLTLGDVSLATTVSSTMHLFLDSDGAPDADISLGNVVLDFNSGTSADLELFIGHAGYTGDIHIASLQVFQTVTDDTVIVDLADITADFSAAALTQQLTIGTVDFSGFVNNDPDAADADSGVSIDVSGILGNVRVIGSDFDDLILDNAKTNKLTGGDGADKFSFVSGNTGKTLATADEITDFSHADDTIEFHVTDTSDFTADTYTEGTFASFAAFIAGANAAMTSALEDNLVAGQVGSDTFLAIDTDDGDNVDFVVKLTGVSIAQLDFSDYVFI